MTGGSPALGSLKEKLPSRLGWRQAALSLEVGVSARPKLSEGLRQAEEFLSLHYFSPWGHTWRCSGLTSGFAFRGYSDDAQGTICDIWIQTGSVVHETSALPTVLYLCPQQVVFLHGMWTPGPWFRRVMKAFLGGGL